MKKKIEDLQAPKKLQILCTIVQRNKADFYMNALEGYDVNYQTICYAKGTAPSDALIKLGITDDSKAIIFSVLREDKIKEVTTLYEEKLFKTRGGKGIAFTIPLDSIIGVMVYRFLANIKEE